MRTGVRVAKLRKARGWSQTELARRVGLSQGTIGKLEAGISSGSSHLHRIARVLGTTAAYLACEIDDPGPDAVPPAVMPTEQFATLRVALPDPRALQRMFLGVLIASRGMSEDELSHELAKRLPSGLELLRGPLIFEDDEDQADAPAEQAEAQPIAARARRRASRR